MTGRQERTSFDAAVDYLARRRKAVMGFFAPGVSALAVALTTGDQHVSGHEWLLAGVACVVTAFGVGAVRNREG